MNRRVLISAAASALAATTVPAALVPAPKDARKGGIPTGTCIVGAVVALVDDQGNHHEFTNHEFSPVVLTKDIASLDFNWHLRVS